VREKENNLYSPACPVGSANPTGVIICVLSKKYRNSHWGETSKKETFPTYTYLVGSLHQLSIAFLDDAKYLFDGNRSP